MEILKFLTAGSVDDGKSTLIGRLLYETGSLTDDQIAAARANSSNGKEIDLAAITDGLSDEQEQGITIDVSYKYFTTESRRFIIADCPGHEQYTRNMVTGASNSDLILLLINAKNGIASQTALHVQIAQFLKIPQMIVCINKMDLVDYAEGAFETIKETFTSRFNSDTTKLHFVPTCALKSDNIVHPSTNMNWYAGPTVLNLLETIQLEKTENTPFRFPVQHTVKSTTDEQVERYYLGSVFSGSLHVGDGITILPGGQTSTIKKITQYKTELNTISTGDYAGIVIADDVSVSRGDLLVKTQEKQPTLVQSFKADLCWMDTTALNLGMKYKLMHGTQQVFCKFIQVTNKVDGGVNIELNNLFEAEIRTSKSLPVDAYAAIKELGSFIIINPVTNSTVAAGVIL